MTDETATHTTVAADPQEQAQAGRARRRRAQEAGWPRVAISAFVIALAACGSTSSAQTAAQPPASSASASAVKPAASLASSSSTTARATALVPRPVQSRIDQFVARAKQIYFNETNGWKLRQQLQRIGSDGILLNALSRGDLAGAQAEGDAQLRAPINHYAHVTRISVISGSRVLVNATVNSDGVFVVAPGTRALRLRGRLLGTLLVSLQDVTGFVKLTHRDTGAEVLARGGSGHVRTSLAAAAAVRLPASGRITIAGRGYLVRSFREVAWGNEPLTVWILQRV
jgi:hypothetical protein